MANTKEGWVEEYTGYRWVKSYIVLQSNFLLVFAKPPGGLHKPRARVDVTAYHAVRRDDLRSHTFALTPKVSYTEKDKNKKTLTFTAPDERTVREWIDAIGTQQMPLPKPVSQPGPTRNPYLPEARASPTEGNPYLPASRKTDSTSSPTPSAPASSSIPSSSTTAPSRAAPAARAASATPAPAAQNSFQSGAPAQSSSPATSAFNADFYSSVPQSIYPSPSGDSGVQQGYHSAPTAYPSGHHQPLMASHPPHYAVSSAYPQHLMQQQPYYGQPVVPVGHNSGGFPAGPYSYQYAPPQHPSLAAYPQHHSSPAFFEGQGQVPSYVPAPTPPTQDPAYPSLGARPYY